MKMVSMAAVVIVGLFSARAGATGQEKEKGKASWPCEADIIRLCEGVEPGDGRLMKCLDSQWDQVSEECKKSKSGKTSAKKEKDAKPYQGKKDQFPRDFQEKCGADAQRLCAERTDLGKCLHENLAELSAPCRALKEKGMSGEKKPKD